MALQMLTLTFSKLPLFALKILLSELAKFTASRRFSLIVKLLAVNVLGCSAKFEGHQVVQTRLQPCHQATLLGFVYEIAC